MTKPALDGSPPDPAVMPSSAQALQRRYQALRARIAQAAERAGRCADAVTLLAVSKTFPAQDVLTLAECGQTAFGENYLQEAELKIAACQAARSSRFIERSDRPDKGAAPAMVWHFIGPIQSNKTRGIAEHFDWVQSVDQARLASRLAAQRPATLPPLQVCIQVNLAGEPGKRGCPPEQVLSLAQHIKSLPALTLRGMMVIPEAQLDPATLAHRFAQGRQLYEALQAAGMKVDTLSMGMSDDLETAIAAGSTMVRLGSGLFGSRDRAALK